MMRLRGSLSGRGPKFLALLLLALPLPRIAAAECVDYGDFLHVAGRVETLSGALDVALSGTRAYVVYGQSGLSIFEATDPAHPTLLGTYVTSDPFNGIVVNGDRAYLAAGPGGVVTLDVSDPSAPQQLDRSPQSCELLKLALQGGVLVGVGHESGGCSRLETFTLADPDAPTLSGELALGEQVKDLALEAGMAAVIDNTGVCYLIDISTPASPALAGQVDSPLWTTFSYGLAAALSGERLFTAWAGVTDWGSCTSYLVAYDVSDPAAPLQLGDFTELFACPGGGDVELCVF